LQCSRGGDIEFETHELVPFIAPGGFLINIITEPIQSIYEPVTNIQLSPNPTSNTTTLTLNIDTPGHLCITLNNLLGQELFEIHNAFTTENSFATEFSIKDLPTGIYYIKILHNDIAIIEKLIKQ